MSGVPIGWQLLARWHRFVGTGVRKCLLPLVESLLQPLLSARLPGLSQFKRASQRASPCKWAGHNQPRLLNSNKVVANIATNEPTPRKR
ncbi:MAG TPA: hypothetical protein VFB70_17385 [Pyrinomonadaceae bacterium]|nr:hypothetical protein [Pyrinomonadaceae bacterium]